MGRFASFRALPLAGMLACTGTLEAQPSKPADPPAPPAEVLVVGRRGQVATDIQALATFDADAVAASGATSMAEFLRTIQGVTQSADGQDPIFLLNGQRESGYPEIGNLPPEAIEKVEVLPEPVALRFGYPPTRRVVNFITKRRFHQLALKPSVGTSTDGGANVVAAHTDLTRLRGDGRLTLTLDARHTDALLQSSRHVRPDPDVPFDAIGNVTGLTGGEIDPALSRLAGVPVTIAPVPTDAPTLAGFAASANQPRLFDLSPLHSLAAANDTLHGEAVVADKLGRGMSGSITLTADHSRDATLYGPATAALLVPGGNPFSPFVSDVLLQRYLVEAAPLRQRTQATTLHAGGVVRGAWHGWQWDLTGTLDTSRRSGTTEKAIDLSAAQAAIAAGTDPFQPLTADLVTHRLVDRTLQVTHGASAKVVAITQPLRLPAGPSTLTTSVEVERQDSRGQTRGASLYDAAFGRARIEGQVALDLPIASKSEDVLPWVGDLSANGSVAVRRIGGFGTLADTTAGFTWTPLTGVQLTGQLKRAAIAPTLDQLAAPLISAPQVSLFDFGTGRSTLVTLLVGGNPSLAAEHRDTRTLGLTWKPFAKHELRIGLSYEATAIRNGIQTIYALTPATIAAFPNLFMVGLNGMIATAAFRPVNIDREKRQALNLTLNATGQLGREKPAGADGKSPPRPYFYGGLGPTLRLEERLTLSPGQRQLDLLNGATLSSGTTPRIAGYGYGGVGHRGKSIGFDFYCMGGATLRGSVAASTLSFSPICRANANASLALHGLLPRATWSKRLVLKLEVSNLTDARQHVQDAIGNTPYRYQRDLLEPIGRTVTLSLRKLL